MSIVAEVLKLVLLVLGAAAVIAFVIHNIRSEKAAAKRKNPSEHDRAVSPNALANRLIKDVESSSVVLCRIQTPKASECGRIRKLLEEQGHSESSHIAVENGVVVSCYPHAMDQVETLARTTQTILKDSGFSEGSCLFWTPRLNSEALLTWILRGDNRQPTGPMRLGLDVSNDSVE